jgi:hypothetical protein
MRIGRIRTALSLGRIVVINVLALAVTAAATVHVLNRPTGPRPAPLLRGVLAAHPTATTTPAAPASSSGAPSIEVDLERADPVGSARAPASPGVNDVARP